MEGKRSGRQTLFQFVVIIQCKRGGGTRRNRAGVDQMAVFVFPAGADPAVRGPVGGGEAVEAGDDMRPEEDMLKPRGCDIRQDAAEAFIEPGADLAEHNMIERDIAFGIDWPILVEGGRAILDPPDPGRFGLAGCEPVRQVIDSWRVFFTLII